MAGRSGKNLTVYLTSDVTKFKGGLRSAEKEARGWGGRLKGIGSKAGLALAGGFAAAAAAGTAFAVEGIKGAIDDQESQGQLATALKNTTKATDAQVASMEDWIKTQQQLTGISDNELRAGMARFVRSTKDTKRAQQLADTAMKISIATGKDYGTVASALAKAQDGNANSLKRLGLTIGPVATNYTNMLKATRELKAAEDTAATTREKYGKKSREYAAALDKVRKAQEKIAAIKANGGTKWLKELNGQFEGAIQTNAKTYAGKIRRVADAWGELQEVFGTGVISNLGQGNEGMGDLADTLYGAQDSAASVGESVASIATGLAEAAQHVGPLIDLLNKLNEIDGGNLQKLDKIIAGTQFITGSLTGNDQAAQEAAVIALGGTVDHRDPSLPRKPYKPPEQTLGQSLLGSVDPTRYTRRAQNADARGKARSARSRARP